MIPGSLKPFFRQLLEATDIGEVSWQEGAAQNSYFCTHKTYNLYFQYQFDEDRGAGSYIMRLQNGPKAAVVVVDDQEEDFSLMRNIYSSVTVSAADMSGIVDDFFS